MRVLARRNTFPDKRLQIVVINQQKQKQMLLIRRLHYITTSIRVHVQYRSVQDFYRKVYDMLFCKQCKLVMALIDFHWFLWFVIT